MDNSLLISKYIQYILEHSNEIADILDPEHAPHTDPETETEQEEQVFTLQGSQEETNNLTEGTEDDATGETGEPEVIVHDYTQRIFPLVFPDNLTFPFIVHGRSGITVNYTKDLPLGFGWYNTVNYTVRCVSDDYVQCIELANAVRHTMEGCTWKKEDIYIHPIQLLTVSEYTNDDAFVEELQFQMTVE